MKSLYAVILHPTVPTVLLEVLRGYVHDSARPPFFWSLATHPAGRFLECVAIKDKDDDKGWTIQIPTDYVLAIADMTKDKPPVGFLQNS